MQRSRALQIAGGFSAAVLLNIIFLAFLLLEKVSPQWSLPSADAPAVQLLLGPVQAPTPRSTSREVSSASPAVTASRPYARPRAVTDVGGVGTRPTQKLAASPPTSTTPPAAAPISKDDELRARASAALRRLGACSDFTDRSLSNRGCAKGWADTGAQIDPLTSSARANFDMQKTDPDARVLKGDTVRDSLVDHSAGGSNFHYGCTLKYGKWQCSTY